ncbi:Na+/H+ antiporter NhaA [Trujillonella endophytica]|uniref:Na(+)/H(+) antiporter NhaA n=1 Tax=Trujillonella endophytica TaxID=673521 RepID=A0A1H8TN91_9ACTN|nr:Na+/H+ antiporter NhaA [Trujillella endophytica]SEO92337.1 sodium/proton antiporter, NhaA family (TC 2.A.33.1.1) [Trujillella endophytica]
MSQPPRPGPPTRVTLPTLSPSSRLYVGTEAGGSALLLAATLCALAWANSPWSAAYDTFWSTPASIGVGEFTLQMDLRHWVNDGAMALFFLVVGLEITREVSTGELRDRRSMAAPALGALGGLVVPALVYLAFNPSGEAAGGWGIVMSTDTAFVLGVLALFGPRCPDRLRLFLLTLAIVDDIGAITVMALFYSDDLVLPALAVSAALVVALLALRWAGVWRLWPYVAAGTALWLAVHESGIHATLAGVVLGLLLPSRPPTSEEVQRTSAYGRALREQPDAERARMASLAVASTVPANARLQHRLHRWTAYAVVPVFGLANAGVPLDPATLREAFTSPVTIGVMVALLLGNAVGITLGATVALRTGLGILPGGVRWSHLGAGATLAGIGFTISLFIADLAFRDAPALREQAMIGILGGSLAAAVLGVALLRFLGDRFPLCTPEAEGPPSLPPRPWLEPRVPA